MKGFDVLKVKSAVKSHNKFDLSRTHLTTMNFGEIVPLLAEETVPGDKFSINANYFSRMAPLAKPTYGKFSFKTVSAFVPYHQIAYDADAWLAGKSVFEGSTPHQRFFTMDGLVTFIRTNCVLTGAAADDITADNCDWTYRPGSASGSLEYYKFSTKGKYWIKVLNALGYAVPQAPDYRSGSGWYANIRNKPLSAYPLLAFFKLYNDYMSQSQRFNTSALSSFLQDVKYGRTISTANVFDATTGKIGSAGLKIMFDNLLLNYENDYFTSAWQSPNAALFATEGVTEVGVPSSNSRGDKIYSDVDDQYLSTRVNSGDPGSVYIYQRALDFLKSFDDWVRRNNYSGSRAVQQVYSRFGIKTDDYKSHYANVLATDSIPIQVGDVTATASTSVNNEVTGLGDYSGKGIVSGSNGVNCQVSDYGILLILGYYTVTPMMAYGFDRKVLRTEPLDYYNPEFDGLGADAISLGEVYENPLGGAISDTTSSLRVFGFTERYNSYRYGRDQITGEFRNYRDDADMNVWHTGRLLGDARKAGEVVAQSSTMNTLPQTDSEYNRIFSVTDGEENKFYLTAQFNVSAIRPMLSLNQVPKLGEGDTVVPRNGNTIS